MKRRARKLDENRRMSSSNLVDGKRTLLTPCWPMVRSPQTCGNPSSTQGTAAKPLLTTRSPLAGIENQSEHKMFAVLSTSVWFQLANVTDSYPLSHECYEQQI